MKGLAPHVAIEFCSLCDWAYQSNQIHRHLFDDNRHSAKLRKSKYGLALGQLSVVTVEYAVQQIAKLHDKAIVAGNPTLSVDYVMTYGGWEEPVRGQLESIRKDLDAFADKLRHARNKALSHNDLAAILAAGVLGVFEENEDLAYFDKLKEFACIVSREVRGVDFSYSADVTSTAIGIIEMMDALSKSLDA